jgi:hypothetical protein
VQFVAISPSSFRSTLVTRTGTPGTWVTDEHLQVASGMVKMPANAR